MSIQNALPASFPLFKGVPAEKIPRVLSCLNASVATYDKHESILERGETLRFTGYVCKGRARRKVW